MKALSLTQPWATLIALGHKKVETRGWSTLYRGTIAIHAAKAMDTDARQLAHAEFRAGRLPVIEELPRGVVIATARLVRIRPTEGLRLELGLDEIRLGNYAPGRFAWFLEGVVQLEKPVPARGKLGLWERED